MSEALASETDPLRRVALHRIAIEARGELRDKTGVATASQQIVDTLRPLAEAEPAVHGSTLAEALQQLSEAKRRAGDWLGSFGPAREAKAWAKRLR